MVPPFAGLPQPSVSEGNLFFVGPTTTVSDPFGFFARFDLKRNRWRPLPRKGAPRPRAQHLQAAVSGRLVMYLGQAGSGHAAPRLTDGGSFDPSTETWETMAEHPHAIGFDAAIPFGEQLLIWRYGYTYDFKTRA